MPDEEQVHIAKARQDNQEFDRLLAEYRPRLYGVCLRLLGSREDAEDAVVETSLRAWKSIDQFRGEGAFFSWLCRIAGHTCTDIARRRKPPTSSLESPSAFGLRDARPTPEQAVIGPPCVGEVLELAQRTKPPWDALDYLIFGRHYGDGMELKEIAQELGKPEGTIRGRVHDRIKPVFQQLRQAKERAQTATGRGDVSRQCLRVEESADHA